MVTRFLSPCAERKLVSTGAQNRRQGDTAGLKDLARHAGSLTAKDVPLAVGRNFHLNQVVQIADYVSPFQLPLPARLSVLQFLA